MFNTEAAVNLMAPTCLEVLQQENQVQLTQLKMTVGFLH